TSYNILKISYPGTGIASVQTNMTNAVVPKRDITRTKDIVDIWIGTNDIASGTETGLSLYNKYIAVHAQARAVGFKTCANPILARSSVMAVSQATFDDESLIFNDLLAANWATFSDAFSAYNNDPVLCAPGASNNTTYFQGDKIHLNETGRNYLVENYKYPTLLSL